MANKVIQLYDSFRNLVANLGTERDKAAAAQWSLQNLSSSELQTIYRVSWMARKTVDIPAQDATRRWREWTGLDTAQIQMIEQTEMNFQLANRVEQALKLARMIGGAGIYFSIDGDDPATPVNLQTIEKGSLKFITVISADVLVAGELDRDPISANYGRPKYFQVTSETGGMVNIHPSRIIAFHGNPILDPQYNQGTYKGWGDSVLLAAHDAIRSAEATAHNIESLIYEAKVDIFGIPNLADIMRNPQSQKLLEDRMALAAKLKGNNGMLIRDAEEMYDTKSFNFAGLPEINRQALQAVAGASDIPITRFLGQTPSGLSSTGESDLKNYYDSVASMQELELTPTLRIFDEVMIRSTFGERPPEASYDWRSLWQLTDLEKADITVRLSQSISSLAMTRLFREDELAEAAVTLLSEHSMFPSMETDITDLDRYIDDPPIPEFTSPFTDPLRSDLSDPEGELP